MNLRNAKHVRDLIYFGGPLLSLYDLDGQLIMVYWLDVDEKVNTWNAFTVTKEGLEQYLEKSVNIRDLQERATHHWIIEGYIEEGEVNTTTYAELRGDWKAPTSSFFDETLTYEAMYPNGG